MGPKRLKPGAMKTISDEKLTTFVIGTQKKSRFQKEREAREAKKKQEMAEAANIYADFVASFEGDDDTKTFVREGAEPSSDRLYTMDGAGKRPSRTDVPAPSAKKKKMSEMELLLEEMKNKDRTTAAPEQKTVATPAAPPIEDPGSFDDGDPETTNLYVGNLAPSITEEQLNEEFAKYGKIYSVKIMWPRTEEEKARKRNCGFVSFMQRQDAEDAKNALNDLEIDGHHITVGWGKAIKKLPQVSSIGKVPPGLAPQVQTKLESALPAGLAAGKWDTSVPLMREMQESDEKVIVVFPKTLSKRKLIDRLARYIAKDGMPLENIIREREKENPMYECLNDPKSQEGIYYRWKVYSLLMGDKEHVWKEKPFQMNASGPFWIPPKLDDSSDFIDDEKPRRGSRSRDDTRLDRYKYATGAQFEKARDRARRSGASLTDNEYTTLEEILRGLTNSRQVIKEGMGFALDHPECSEEIVQTLKESLMIEGTPLNTKIARLYLLSDILHNSSAPVKHASAYRTLIQECLPKIFEHLNAVFLGLGRMSAKNFEEKVMRLLSVWEEWSLYSPMFILGLEATFQRKPADLEVEVTPDGSLEDLIRRAKQHGVHYDSRQDDEESITRKLNQVKTYMEIKTSTVSASPLPTLSNVIFGKVAIPTAPSRGAWGTVDEDDEDIDGVALDDEDIDGVPFDELDDDDDEPVNPPHQQKKRDRRDSSGGSSDDEESGPGKIDLFDDAPSSSSGKKTQQVDEKMRSVLRRVENEMIELRDKYEAQGKRSDEIDRLISAEREERKKKYLAQPGTDRKRPSPLARRREPPLLRSVLNTSNSQ